MPRNSWDVTAAMIDFFEKVVRSNKRFASLERESEILFRVKRSGGFSGVNLLLVNRYTIGIADVMRAKAEFPSLTCIVANGAWCGYTREAKEYGKQNNIGVYTVSEIGGALMSRNANGYARKDQKGNPTYAYR